MKGEKIYKALGDIDDEILDESKDFKKKSTKTLWIKWGSIAACFVLCASVAVAFAINNKKVKSGADDSQLSTTANFGTTQADGNAASGETNESFGDTALMEKWNDRSITDKFPETTYNNVIYSVMFYGDDTESFSANEVAKKLSDVSLKGYDVYEDKSYTTTATAYSIKNISPNIIIALKFADDENYYLYKSSKYLPATLGALINDLNFEKDVEFGYSYIWYIDKDYSYTIDDIDDNYFLNILKNNKSLKTLQDVKGRDISNSIDITISDKRIGITNRAFTVFSDGYITTNIIDYEATYFVGKSVTDSIFDYVEKTGKKELPTTVIEQEYSSYNADSDDNGSDDAVSYTEVSEAFTTIIE